MVYGLGHTIVRLFGSEQARQRAVKGARRNFIAVGITIHPLPPKHKPTRWSVFVLCWDKNLLLFCVFLVQLWVNPVGTLVGGVINNYGDKV